ncbi:MAG: DUF503 domain-containing protein [Gaiellaceae bacterium]|jgi:uncharacterized protein YlxP (DUF503 family)
MGKGYVGILAAELHFPEAGSLKDKRQYLRSAKAQLQNRFGASVAEVDFHDVWQRSRLVIALAAYEASSLEQLMDGAERYLRGQQYELVALDRRVVTPSDE